MDYAQQQIGDDSGAGHNEGITRSVDVEKPQSGSYQVIATGGKVGMGWVSLLALTQSGALSLDRKFSFITSPGSTTTFRVQYTSASGASSQVEVLATLEGLLNEIVSALQMNWIDNQGLANSLSQKIQAASQSSGPARLNQLNAFVNEVNAQSGKHIGSAIAQILLQDANALISQSQ